MHQSSDKTLLPAYRFTGNAFIWQPDAGVSDQTAHPTTATSTPPSAATPRTGRLLPHTSANVMEAANVHNTLKATELLLYTADVKQCPEIMDCIVQPPAKQSSQLDSLLLSKLPRELRDKIYREAVVEKNEIPIRVLHYERDGVQRRYLSFQHPLMRVCKQTRQEVADIDHLENTFRITNDMFDKRAIKALARHFAPWAGKVKKLGISHDFAQRDGDLAKINFSISASQGRIVVEPESFTVREMSFMLHASPGSTNRVTRIYHNMCFCKIHSLALENGCCDVLSWVQHYVHLVLTSQAERNAMPHCWTCAGRTII
jgi:hypothetical protein